MKTFLAIYTGTPEAMERSGWNALSEQMKNERTQSGLKAWHAWMKSNQGRVVVAGGPIGKASSQARTCSAPASASE